MHYDEAVRIGGDIRAGVGSLVRMAHIHMTRRADDQAERAITAAQQMDPSNSEVLLMQARLWLLKDKPRRAAKTFEELSRRESVATSALLGLAEAALISGDQAAIGQARKRILLQAGDIPEKRVRAAILAQEDAQFFSTAEKNNIALFLAELAFFLDPSRSVKESLAMIRYQANLLDEAAALFQELLSEPKSEELSRAMLAQIEIQRKELQLGEKRARLRELQSAARIAESGGNLAEAIRHYEEIMAFGQNVFAREVLDAQHALTAVRSRYAGQVERESKAHAFEAMRSGRYADAVEELRKARAVIGTNLVLDGMLAEALLKSATDLDAAKQEAALREILDIELGLQAVQSSLPSSILAQAHVQLGLLMESQTRWVEAVEHYEAARARSSVIPNLSRRLLVARVRANLLNAFLILAAIGLAAAAAIYRWPHLHRTIAAFVRYRMALSRGNRDGEYHALTALVALLPHRTDLRIRLGRMANDRGDEEVSLYLYEQLRRERSLDKEQLLRLFELYERRQDMEKAYGVIVDLLRESSMANPARARLLETKFRLDLAAGRVTDAYQAGRELFMIMPTAWVAEEMVKLTRARADTDVKSLLMFFRAWVRLQPVSSERIVAEVETVLGTLATAERLEQDPGVRELAQFVVDLHMKMDNLRGAAELLENLRLSEKNPLTTLHTLLKIYTSLKDTDAMLRTHRLLYEAQLSNFEFGMNYAAQLRKLGDEPAAEEVFLKLLTHHPNSVELVKTLTESAKRRFDAADISQDPAGLDRAVEFLRTIIGLTVLDTKEIRLLLAKSLIKKGQTDEAIAILQAIEGGGYPRFKAQALTAEAFVRKNQPGLAVDIISKINLDDPNITDDLRKEMQYLQAEALEARGLPEEAAVILDRLILQDITYRDVKARHERLSHVRRRVAAQEACPQCGKPNTPGARFCASCGSSIQPA